MVCKLRTANRVPQTQTTYRKLRIKTYVAILRCNIRNLAYLCTAQN